MWVSQDFLRSIVPLGIPDPNEKPNIRWLGSAFWVSALDGKIDEQTGEPTYQSWLVTARHLLKDREFIVLGLNSDKPLKSLCFPTAFSGTSGWHSYSEDDPAFGDVDLAVIPIQYQFLLHYGVALPKTFLDKNTADQQEIQVAQPILSFGYPSSIPGHGADDEPFRFDPVVRFGIISRVPWVHGDTTGAFLVDMQDSHGNSGGPVIFGFLRQKIEGRDTDSRLLAGVVVGFLPDHTPILQKGTNSELVWTDKDQNPIRGNVRQNSGLAKVESAHHISKLIESYPHSKVGLSWDEAKELDLL